MRVKDRLNSAAIPRVQSSAADDCSRSSHYVKCCTGQSEGDVQLVQGQADPGGVWEYGRLEVVRDGVWTSLVEWRADRNFGEAEAHVACQTLGYTTGAQLLAGCSSPFVAPKTAFIDPRIGITCNGTETLFSECEFADDMQYDMYYECGSYEDLRYYDDAPDVVLRVITTSVVCSNPSGMHLPSTIPG